MRLTIQRDRERGGGTGPVSIDARNAEGGYRLEPADATTPARLFDRAWALTLVDCVLDLLEREHADPGRMAFFDRLKFVLTEGPRAAAYAAIADDFGMTEAAIDGAVRRLRLRCRSLLPDKIAATLDDPRPDAIADEIMALFAALDR
jgi:hypothetical protein